MITAIGRLAKEVGTEDDLAKEHLVMAALGISPEVSDRLLDEAFSD
ncbi:MAG: hypothetical protein ACE144_21515 [Thermodesulfobacteriota bacterium]